jgi:hypothetical protein
MAEQPLPSDDGDHQQQGTSLTVGPPGEPELTMTMVVAEIGFLLERLGADCDDLQYLRELTKNSLEANADLIIWDVDWLLYQATGVYKLCCIDNGRGMSDREMVQHINHLSSSGRVQAMDANYGVGAKISAATRNPAGVVYQSWQEGRGSMIQLWRDPYTGEYGLKQFRLPDGSYNYVVPLGEAAKPEQIDQHGTKVTLLGRDDEHDTVAPPEGVSTPSRWFARYLNARYYDFPEDVTVRAREGWTHDIDDTDRNVLRRVRGMREFLDEHAEHQGVVELADCLVHWTILDDSDKRRKSSELPNAGHFAALHKGEVYEMIAGRGGTARLQQFGVLFGTDRVVLYVEPRNGAKRSLSANTARTQLLLDNAPLPYAEWAHDFREQMPQEIKDHMDAVIAGTTGADHSQTIMERLKSYVKLFQLSRYRTRVDGSFAVADLVTPARPPRAQPTTEREPIGEPRKRPGSQTGDLLASMLAADGVEAEATRPSEPPVPRVVWLSEADGSRSSSVLDDRAAKFLPEDNLIQANADFRVFTDMADYWCDEYGVERDNKAVVDVVREWFEQALVETVIGCQALQGERRWSPNDIEVILSEEALTAATMQRYHVANAVKRTLGAKLGSLKERAGTGS